jgi:lysophospholipase L1-like esterase
MKFLFLSLFVLGFGCAALAQDAPAPVSAQPMPAVGGPGAGSVPAADSTTSPDNATYVAKPELLTHCQQRLAAINGKPCDLIFIGDSITEFWATAGKAIWDAKYAPLHALNFGVAGDKTQNVLWRLGNMDVQNLKPKVAVVMIGTNNYEDSAHEIADGIKAILTNTQATFPGVKIILVSILPNERASEKMTQVDSLIKNDDDGTSTFYLDLVPLMPEVTTTNADGTTNSNWKGMSKDRLHPDASGYQIWADAMDPLLKKLMAGK